MAFKKLPARYNVVAVPFLLSLIMSGLISAIATLRGLGFVDGVVSVWLHSWMASWMVAFPVVMVVLPTVRRIAGLVVEKPRS